MSRCLNRQLTHPAGALEEIPTTSLLASAAGTQFMAMRSPLSCPNSPAMIVWQQFIALAIGTPQYRAVLLNLTATLLTLKSWRASPKLGLSSPVRQVLILSEGSSSRLALGLAPQPLKLFRALRTSQT